MCREARLLRKEAAPFCRSPGAHAPVAARGMAGIPDLALQNGPGSLHNGPGSLHNGPGALQNATGSLHNGPGALRNVGGPCATSADRAERACARMRADARQAKALIPVMSRPMSSACTLSVPS